VLGVTAEPAFESERFTETLGAAQDALAAAKATRRVWEATTSRPWLVRIFAAQGSIVQWRCVGSMSCSPAWARATASAPLLAHTVPIAWD
jgi:hypothetical protein